MVKAFIVCTSSRLALPPRAPKTDRFISWTAAHQGNEIRRVNRDWAMMRMDQHYHRQAHLSNYPSFDTVLGSKMRTQSRSRNRPDIS